MKVANCFLTFVFVQVTTGIPTSRSHGFTSSDLRSVHAYAALRTVPRWQAATRAFDTLFQTVINDPINIFMTNISNYDNDRLALYTFESVVKFLRCWTNVRLASAPPLALADKAYLWYQHIRSHGDPVSKKFHTIITANDSAPKPLKDLSRDLCETDSILFGATVAVCRIIDAKLPMAGRATTQSNAIPAWRKRIEDRIAKARALIGRLTSFRSGNNRPRIVRTVRMAFADLQTDHLSQPDITQKLTERIDDLKQKIAAWGKRIRRFSEGSRRFNQNRLFQSDQKRLYKSLERPKVCGAGQGTDQADIVAFWRGLWSEPVNHSEGPWMEVVASQGASVTPVDPITITPEDVAEAVRRAPNRKSPGLDGHLHHYWLKGFIVCHAVLARQFQEALDQKSLPSLFTTGITHLVPKDQDTTDPSKYRPITYKRKRTHDVSKRVSRIEQQLKATPVIEARISELETKLAEFEQKSRNCNIEISNLPEKRSENLNTITG
ncbi:unnamed protein product [Parnassius apollo]|uniref:(apollo) hypothetical protein n=1 Tax=Parnassius apollo TaxID=110799 RepID=A0A8S3W5N9_PARAO|nr:unnamed protein product [Parnassius apollo]